MFIKVSDIKFHGNPSSGNHVDTCGQTDGAAKTKVMEDFCE